MRKYVITLFIYIAGVTISTLVLDPSTVRNLGKEDGFYEYFTALCFLLASVFFFFSYRKTKPESKRLRLKPAAHLFFLALAVVFFFGFGEEISWGQRIFHIQTPQFLMKTNIQKELNIHNIDMFNLVGKDNQMKPLWKRYLTTAVGLFHVFSLLFCLIIPFAYRYFAFARKGLLKISFPVVPLRLGLFFALSWIFYKILVIRLSDQGREFLSSLAEIKESQIAFLFVVIAFYFLNTASSLKPKKETELFEDSEKSSLHRLPL